jgi:hypothetical protein
MEETCQARGLRGWRRDFNDRAELTEQWIERRLRPRCLLLLRLGLL